MKGWYLLLIFVFISLTATAQSLEASVSNDSILLGNYFIYELTIENSEDNVDAPDLSSFSILSGPNMSNSVSIVNGDMSSSKSMSWTLKPEEVGQYFIDPVAIEVDGEILETLPIEIMVYPNPDGIIVQPESKNSFDDFFNLQMPPLFDNQLPRPKQGENKKQEQPAEDGKKKRKLKKG